MKSMISRFRNTISGKIKSYDLTQEQISLFRKRIRDADNLEEEEVQKNQKKWKYTTTEDKAILSYITTNQEYARVGSSKLWKEMEKENVLEGRGWLSMMNRFRKIMENVGSYDLTEEQISSLKKKLVVKDKEEELIDVGEKEDEEDNMSMGMDETGIENEEEMEDDVGEVCTEDEEEVDDPEGDRESGGMSEEEEEEEEKDLHGEEEMEEDNFSKDDDKEYSEDEDDEEDEPYKAYILVDF